MMPGIFFDLRHFFILLVLGLACHGPSNASDAGLVPFEKRFEQVAAEPEIVGLAVAVVKAGDVIWQRTTGPTHQAGMQIDEDTRFRIASLSKGFAATTALILAQDGRLSLDQTARDAAPYFQLKRQSDRATLEHVLSHRLGLPPYAYDNLLEANRPIRTIFQRLAKVDLVCPVGDCYVYQNVAFSLVEPAVAKAAGQPFESVVAEALFQPLKMTQTGFGLDHLTRDENWARPHRAHKGQIFERDPKPAYYRVPSAGGINASLADMTLWLKAQMGRRPDVVSPTLLADLHRARVETGYQDRRVRWMRGRVRNTRYGLGWRIYDYRGHRLIYHGGGVGGYRAMIAFVPDRDIGLVALWNSTSCKGWPLLPMFFDAVYDLEQGEWDDRPC